MVMDVWPKVRERPSDSTFILESHACLSPPLDVHSFSLLAGTPFLSHTRFLLEKKLFVCGKGKVWPRKRTAPADDKRHPISFGKTKKKSSFVARRLFFYLGWPPRTIPVPSFPFAFFLFQKNKRKSKWKRGGTGILVASLGFPHLIFHPTCRWHFFSLNDKEGK
jgi:hypothetical protein